jgi:predicted secreted protein
MAIAYQPEKIALGGEMMIFVNPTGTTMTTIKVTPIAFATSASLSISTDTIDVTSKDSGTFKSYRAGMLDWEMSTENLYTYALTGTGNVAQVDALIAAQLAQTVVGVKFAQKSGTTPEWTVSATPKNFNGKAIITKFEVKAGSNSEVVSYSITLKGTDALAYSVLA